MSSTSRPITWLVSGASRGIGFELVRQLVASPGNLVVAAVRNPEKATALGDLQKTSQGRLHVVRLDVSDFDSIRALSARLEPILGELGLDYLVNNAAVAIYDTAFTIEPENLLSMLRTNTVAPALVSQVVLPFLEKGRAKKILHVSSVGGSIGGVYTKLTLDEHRKAASYAISKTALNMVAYKQKVERPDFTVIALCPGWVKTDMGGDSALLEPEESIRGIIKVITSATTADSGKYPSYNGEEIPW